MDDLDQNIHRAVALAESLNDSQGFSFPESHSDYARAMRGANLKLLKRGRWIERRGNPSYSNVTRDAWWPFPGCTSDMADRFYNEYLAWFGLISFFNPTREDR